MKIRGWDIHQVSYGSKQFKSTTYKIQINSFGLEVQLGNFGFHIKKYT